MSGGNNKQSLGEWVAISNVVPIVITIISVGISIGYFTSEVKMQIRDVGNEVKLTNQKLDQLAVNLNEHKAVSDKSIDELDNVKLALATLKSQVSGLMKEK